MTGNGPRSAERRRPAGGWGQELGAAKQAVQKAAEAVERLYLDASADDIRSAAQMTEQALAALRAVLAPPSRTGCAQHPHGPVDPDPPQGWGMCAMCNTNRHRGTPPAPVPEEIRAMISAGRAARRAGRGVG